MSTPEAILATYEANAAGYARARAVEGADALGERRWLDQLLEGLAPPVRVLDLGCGPGVPLATELASRGCVVTGVDGAKNMISLFREHLPGATAHVADMRGLDLAATFDAVLAWDSFFHLCPADQESMFAVFRRHCAVGGRLVFTSGPVEGTAIGRVEGAPVYHSSQSPDTYRTWLERAGFAVVSFVPEDPDCGQHSVWLAERRL